MLAFSLVRVSFKGLIVLCNFFFRTSHSWQTFETLRKLAIFFFFFFFNFSTYFRGSQLSDFFFISLFLIQPDSIHFQLLCCSEFCRKILKLGFQSKVVYSFCPKIKYLVRFISSICLNAVIVAIFLFVPFPFMILKDIYFFKGKVFKDSYFLPLTK